MWPSLPQPRSCQGGTIAIWPPTLSLLMNTPLGTKPVRGLWEAKTQLCAANAFFCCLSAATIKNACFTLLGSNQFVWCIVLSCNTVALYHCVHGKSLFVVVFVGPCPFRFLLCFSAGWPKRLSAGGSAFRLLSGCFCVLFCFDLPCYMTTGVNVDFISNRFFTRKDWALERDRPYQRKKNSQRSAKLVQFCYFAEWPFTNEFDDISPGDFFNKSLSFMLAVWPCRHFLCLGPRCHPVVLPGTDGRAMRALGFL